jgi:hypothetical protein
MAAAAFLEQAALLTREPVRRAQRLLAAARAKRDAGALDAALGLLVAAENQGSGPRQALRIAEVEHLRGQIALDQRRGDAARLLLNAARRYEPLNPELARATHLEALWEAAMQSGERDTAGAVREAAVAARTAPPGPDPPRPVDVLLDAFALRFTQGHAPAAPALSRALELVLALDVGTAEASRWLLPSGGRISQIIALELWDFESWHALATRQARLARGAGALVHLQFALNYLARTHLLAGELTTAALMLEEDHLIAEATGNPPVTDTEVMLAAWRGREPEACELIEATVQEAAARGAAGWPASRPTWARYCTTASAGTTPRATPPGRPSSTGSWGTGRSWSRSWPRPRPGRGTWRPHGRRWHGCPNVPASAPPTGHSASRPVSAPF